MRTTASRPWRRRRAADAPTSSGRCARAGDFLALDRTMDEANAGDLLAVYDVGAYGYVMASNYNSRPRGAEVLVDGDRFARRDGARAYEDLVRLERTTSSGELADARRTDGGQHDRVPAVRGVRATDAGEGVSMLHACRRLLLARSRCSPFEEASMSLAGVFGTNDGDMQGLLAQCDARGSGRAVREPAQLRGRRPAHARGARHRRRAAALHRGAQHRRARLHAPAGDEVARATR